jgi:hypothetical protein
VEGSSPVGDGFTPPEGKKNPRCAPEVLGLLVRHCAVDSDLVEWCRLGAGPTLGAAVPAQWNGVAGPSPERAGVRGFLGRDQNWPLLNRMPRGRSFPRLVEFFFKPEVVISNPQNCMHFFFSVICL